MPNRAIPTGSDPCPASYAHAIVLSVVWIIATSTGLSLRDVAFAQGRAPSSATEAMAIAPGLAVRLVAAEPMVRQPVAIEFDERGRLWVIQYLQYPNPAGL